MSAGGLPRPGSARRRCPTKLTAGVADQAVAKTARDPDGTDCRPYWAKDRSPLRKRCRRKPALLGKGPVAAAEALHWGGAKQKAAIATPGDGEAGSGRHRLSRSSGQRCPWSLRRKLSTPGVLVVLRNSSFGRP